MKVTAFSAATLPSAVALLRPSESSSREIAQVVALLIEQVRSRGDAAVVEATARFDWEGADASRLAVPTADIDEAFAEADAELVEALKTTRDNCTFFHQHELTPDWEDVGPQGQVLGIRRLPVHRAGLYVPGGLGSYASTVIMNSVPAVVAGVEELIICTPPGRDGRVNASVLAAAKLMGVERVFRVGGAQAVAAMAYGTETIPRVDVICGPGNAYVMEAKRQVYGSVGIDSLAGPSEVLVVADKTARAAWIASDLLAQEEHGSGAQGVLVAESEALCREVGDALERLTETGACPCGCGKHVSTDRLWAFFPEKGEAFLELAAATVNLYAPEHLELQIADPRAFMATVRSAGAIFVGHRSPTAFGDYIAGSNHVLPTGGSARFASPLSVDTFMRKSSYVEMDSEAVRTLTPRLARLANSEGFYFHRVSAELRSAAID
jgi:histidinol dehydrogenase